jgi:TetR/AcrR family transcriptional repressor of nem operon
MRVTREHFLENREKILAAASRLFREKGYEAVGVADVMKAAGLTHGGFYGHFKSKEDLFAQATRGSGAVAEDWGRMVKNGGPGALEAIARQYLNDKHCKGVGAGCLIAALGPEIARQPEGSRGAVTGHVKGLVEALTPAAPGATEAERRRHAIAAYASWIGAMVLARISDDEAFSREVREAAAAETGA